MKPSVLARTVCALAAVCGFLFSTAPAPAQLAQQPGAGMTVYVDPQTGAVRNDPAPGTIPLQLSPQERNAASTSHDGLVEVPITGPAGGYKLHLQGRFQSPLVGTLGPDGRARAQHVGEPPAPQNTK